MHLHILDYFSYILYDLSKQNNAIFTLHVSLKTKVELFLLGADTHDFWGGAVGGNIGQSV